MRYIEFQHWLQQCTTNNSDVQSNALSRCKSVENYEGDLDQHFLTDRMATLLARLVYSSRDERLGIAPRHSIPISKNANVRLGTSSYANAIRKYLQFCDAWPSGTKLIQPTRTEVTKAEAVAKQQSAPVLQRATTRSEWPEWSLPSKGDLLQLARITIPYIRFLHPNIVRAIVEDNEYHSKIWKLKLHEYGIDPSLYLWERSACAFPGVRRYAGGAEIAQHRGQVQATGKPENALKLDDNHYPKCVWSFIFRGKTFQNQGPMGYSLAHLADHKQYKNRGQEEFDLLGENTASAALYGLYTSVANTVYMPNNLIRPTDFAFTLRNLIQRQANHLYGSFCNLLPPYLSIRTAETGAWYLDAFDWSEPVGTMNYMATFLNFRNQEMEKLFS